MPSAFESITFESLDELRRSSTISQIRRHAMKDVGASRRPASSRRIKHRELLPWPARDHAVANGHEGALSGSASPALATSPTDPQRSGAGALRNSTARDLSCKSDPFNSGCVPINSTVHTLVHYFVHQFHQNGIWVYETKSMPPDPDLFQYHVRLMASAAVADDFTMYCLLTVAAARIRGRDHVQCTSIGRQRGVSMLRALRMLQGRIDQIPLLDKHEIARLLHCIAMLADAEDLSSDRQAAHVHLRAMAVLARYIGGPDGIANEYTRGQVLAVDTKLSCDAVQPCSIFDPQRTDPGPLGSSNVLRHWKGLIDKRQWGQGLTGLASELACAELAPLITQLIETEAVRERARTVAWSPLSTEAISWARQRTAATRASLLALSVCTPVSQALKIALIMFTLLPDFDLTRQSVVNTLAGKLRQTLEASPGLRRDHEGTHFWLLLMGFHCACDATELRNWFFTYILRQWQSMKGKLEGCAEDASLLVQLLRFQQRYFYTANVQQASTEQLARRLGFRC